MVLAWNVLSNPPAGLLQNLRREQALDAKKAIQLALDSRLDELKMDHAMAAVRQAKTVWVGFWEGLLLRVFEAVVHVKLLGSYFSIVQKKTIRSPFDHSESAKHPT